MLTIALCDDEPEQRSRIGAILQNYSAARPELAVKISTFASARELLAYLEEVDGYNIYVLDIVMPVMSGIDLGVRLRELGYRGAIIYLTVSPEYAVDSYAARAFHYLMKPVEPGMLFQVLDQALAELLNAFLRGLSREGRAIFLRRYWYGQGVAEIAKALGCGEGKVKSSLFRSRRALRDYLEKEGIAV